MHNPTVTLMRTTAGGVRRARPPDRRASSRRATGPTALFVPLRGVSMIAGEGGPFHDPEADAALFAAVRESIGADVELVELDATSTTRPSPTRWRTSSTSYLEAAR